MPQRRDDGWRQRDVIEDDELPLIAAAAALYYPRRAVIPTSNARSEPREAHHDFAVAMA